MKTLLSIIIVLISVPASALDLNNLKYYQTSNTLPGEQNPRFAVYIKNDEPCIFLKNFRSDKIQEFCEISGSDFNLKRDFPNVYPSSIRMTRASLYFIAAAPWNEHKCKIYFPDKSITCEPTGKN